jgi:type II secretion system protein G
MRQRNSTIRIMVATAVLAALVVAGAELRAAPATRPTTAPATQPAPGQEARIKRARTDLEALATALDVLEIDCGRFPTTKEGLAALLTRPAEVAGWRGPYISKLPHDPWGHPYGYRCPGEHKNDFDLFSTGPDGHEGGGDDITNWDEK